MDEDVGKGDGHLISGFFKITTTLYPNVNIKAPLRILMGMLKRVMLVVDLVLWKFIII